MSAFACTQQLRTCEIGQREPTSGIYRVQPCATRGQGYLLSTAITAQTTFDPSNGRRLALTTRKHWLFDRVIGPALTNRVAGAIECVNQKANQAGQGARGLFRMTAKELIFTVNAAQ